MTRLDINNPDESSWSIPWKLLFLGGLVVCVLGYAGYQYVRLHPSPPVKKSSATRVEVGAATAKNAKIPAAFDKLQLTREQKDKLEALDKEYADTAAFRKEAMKLLTPEQKAMMQELRKQAEAQRKEKQEKAQARREKFYPGVNAEIAREGDKKIREAREQRRLAAEAAAQAAGKPIPKSANRTPAPTPHPKPTQSTGKTPAEKSSRPAQQTPDAPKRKKSPTPAPAPSATPLIPAAGSSPN